MLRISAVQAEPIWFNTSATVEKTIRLINEAAASGSDLIAFPETWLPGYPIFLWMGSDEFREEQLAVYRSQTISLDGPEIRSIAETARRHNILVSLSFAEKDGENLFIAQALIERDGTVVHARRKLMMSMGHEKSLFASGSADGLQVIDTSIGRIGGMVCSEHARPRLRHELLRQGEQIHVAAWPSFALLPDEARLSAEVNMLLTRQYAADGGIYVVAPTMVLGQTTQTWLSGAGAEPWQLRAGGGHAQIFSPLGEPIGTPLDPFTEGLVTAAADLSQLRPIFDADPLR